MSPYREASPPEPAACQCATGPLFDAEDDAGNNYPVCGPCIDRFTETAEDDRCPAPESK